MSAARRVRYGGVAIDGKAQCRSVSHTCALFQAREWQMHTPTIPTNMLERHNTTP